MGVAEEREEGGEGKDRRGGKEARGEVVHQEIRHFASSQYQ